MRRLLRWRIVLPVILLALAAGYLLATRSEFARARVRETLSERVGARVEFDAMSVGVTATSFSGLRIYEDGGEPFLTVGDAEIDVAAVGALTDRQPTSIRLRDARLLLRFDRAGRLLTRLPQSDGAAPLPTIHFDASVLTIRQEGRSDSVFHGINLDIKSAAQVIELAGTINDADWGKWTLTGVWPANGPEPGRVTLQTAAPVLVGPELLRQVPFVSPTTWDQARLAGTTTAKLELTRPADAGPLRYRLALEPTGTSIEVASIGLNVTGASGGLVAERGTVTLSGVRGVAAGGELRAESRMDFTGPESVLAFQAELAGLDVSRMPRQWRLPEEIDGRISGKVALKVSVPAQGEARLAASGRATITAARIRGRNVPPVELEIRSGRNGELRFDAPESNASGGLVAAIRRATSELRTPILAPVDDNPSLRLKITLRDVELTELLASTGMELPVAVSGRVTAKLEVDAPSKMPEEAGAYRMSGEVSAPALRIDGVAVDNVAGKLKLEQGKLHVSDLSGRLASGSGMLKASGVFDVARPFSFQAALTFDNVPLQQIERFKKLLPESVVLAGTGSGRAAFSGTFDPLAPRTEGEVRFDNLKIGDVSAGAAALRWESDADHFRLRDVRARIVGGEISGQLDIPLRDGVRGAGRLTLKELDLQQLSTVLLSKANVKLEGRANGSIRISDVQAVGRAVAEVELLAPDLKLQGVAAKKVKGVGTIAAGVMTFALTGDALGGQFEVSGQYPPPARPVEKLQGAAPAKAERLTEIGRIKLKRAQLGQLWGILDLKKDLGALAGEFSAELPFNLDKDGRLVGSGPLRAERLRWNETDIAGTAQAIVRISPTKLAIDDGTLFVGEGVARLRLTFNRLDPDRSEAALTLTNVPSQRLLFLIPDVAKRFDLRVDGRLTTTLGREWRGAGVLTSSKGVISGMPVTDVRLPVEWVANASRSRSEIRIRDATATVASGQMSLRTDIRMYNDMPPKLAGDLQFRSVNVSQAIRDRSGVAGNLQLTGRFDFGAEQLRSLDDLTGKVDAKLGESQPFALPVFSALLPYLGLSAASSTTVREGEMHAVLGKGVWRVQSFTLTGSSVDLFADGTISTTGRLGLAVTATTRNRPSQTLLQRFVPVANPLTNTVAQPLGPVGLANLTGVLGRYVVYLEVTGTTEAPTVRLQTLRTLSEDAARFFLFRFLAPLS